MAMVYVFNIIWNSEDSERHFYGNSACYVCVRKLSLNRRTKNQVKPKSKRPKIRWDKIRKSGEISYFLAGVIIFSNRPYI